MMKYKNNNLIVSLAGLLALFVFVVVPHEASARVVGGGGQYLLISDPYIAPANPPTVAPAQPSPTVVTQGATSKNVNGNTDGTVAGAQDSKLSANAISSGSSFMPDTLLEWIFLFILILLGVKLWRNATITDKEKHAPLKHA